MKLDRADYQGQSKYFRGQIGSQSVRSDQSQTPEARVALATDHQVVMISLVSSLPEPPDRA